ncbi:MAG: hypothetical protein QOE55_5175 [Acidobacteriaceae bacterium]|jgi:hypothetical protein|nr:hypothetical protein [Acidobacteriaceae bacterium]
MTANRELIFCVAHLCGKATRTVTHPSTPIANIPYDNTYGLVMTAAAPRLPAPLNFLKSLRSIRSPCAAHHHRGPHRTETPLKHPQKTCFKRFF